MDDEHDDVQKNYLYCTCVSAIHRLLVLVLTVIYMFELFVNIQHIPLFSISDKALLYSMAAVKLTLLHKSAHMFLSLVVI